MSDLNRSTITDNNYNLIDSSKHLQSNSSSLSSCKNLLHWFRKGLRLHDQPALIEGLKNCTTFRCVYLIDRCPSQSNYSINKWRFLIQSLQDLNKNFQKLGSKLLVIRGQPAEVFPPLFKEWSITHLSFEQDPEPFGKIRDNKIGKMCAEMNIEVILRTSHTLYELNTIKTKCNGYMPLTYSNFLNVIQQLDPPPFPLPSITSDLLPNGCAHQTGSNNEKKFDVPTLQELGFHDDDNNLSSSSSGWIGGESEALKRLARHLEHQAWIATFGESKFNFQSLFNATQTSLTPYLRFGCISARLLYHELTKLYKQLKNTDPPEQLYGQLFWREFFYSIATDNPNFDKMKDNPLCVQIPWNYNPEALSKWTHGQTGYPWIDAIQRQLRSEGWIHQIAKYSTACFLTRGVLWISWEEGMKVFDELLIDADWSINAGTWMWFSCSSFFARICHVYCPVKCGKKMDPQGEYIRKYLPALRNMPLQYLHEPWKAPKKVQKEANCILGKNYPLPLINHHDAIKNNLVRMRQVFSILLKDLQLDNPPDSSSASKDDNLPQ